MDAISAWQSQGVALFVSSITLAEWLQGAQAVKDAGKRARARRFYDDVLGRLPVQPLTESDAIEYGRAVGELRAKGITIDFADGLIGCQALQRGDAVATLNTAHFSLIPGLEVVSPNEKAPGDDAEGSK